MQKHNQRAIAYIGVMHSDSVGHDELMADLAFKHASPEDNGSSHMPIAALYDIHGNLPALEAVFAEIRQLEYTREMEEVRARGELRTNSFVRFRRILINEESKIEIEDLGDSKVLLMNRRYFETKAQEFLKRGTLPEEDGWRGWLGQYQAALKQAATELQYPAQASAQDRTRNRARDR